MVPCTRTRTVGPGGKFELHRDGVYVMDDDLRSIYTVMVYLNAPPEFSGGGTLFKAGGDLFKAGGDLFKPGGDLFKAGGDLFKAGGDHSVELTPECGSCVVFNHDVPHAGLALGGGTKYILRCECLWHSTLALP